MDAIKEMLNDEIRAELEGLNEIDFGSTEHKVAVDGIVKLVEKAIEIEKIDVDVQEKEKTRTLDEKLKKEQMELDKELKKEQMELDKELKKEQMELDEKLKREQLQDTRTNNSLTNKIAIASILIPSIITVWGTLKTLKFEETGTVTTLMGRGFINKLIPKR